jgi:hypothetical protein
MVNHQNTSNDETIIELEAIVRNASIPNTTDEMADLLAALEGKLNALPKLRAKAVMAEFMRLMDAPVPHSDKPSAQIPNRQLSSRSQNGGVNLNIHDQVQKVISVELERWLKTRLPKVMADTIEAYHSEDDDKPSQ